MISKNNIGLIFLLLSAFISCTKDQQKSTGKYASKITLTDETDSINYILGLRYGILCACATQSANIELSNTSRRIAIEGFVAGLKQDSSKLKTIEKDAKTVHE